jgi:peptidoglycan/LPS O-acetylase OafA/YrhL
MTLPAFLAAGPMRSLLTIAPLRWLGNMSYSYYLAHGLTLKAIALVIARARPGWHPGAGAHWILLPCAYAVTIASSAALFSAIEKRFSLAPSRRSVDSRLDPAT